MFWFPLCLKDSFQHIDTMTTVIKLDLMLFADLKLLFETLCSQQCR
jgi:hypothetical protein